MPLPETQPLIIKGNYASAVGALLAGCRHFYGYPITPSTEGAELMAKLLPKLDGVFLQAVSRSGHREPHVRHRRRRHARHDLHLRAPASP